MTATGLPEALVHPDLTPPNAIARGKRPPVIIDWIGVGRGPRIWPLAFLLFAAGPRAAKLVLDRYSRSVTLTDEEWDRLPGVMITRPLTLDLWSVAHERLSPRAGPTTRPAAPQARRGRRSRGPCDTLKSHRAPSATWPDVGLTSGR